VILALPRIAGMRAVLPRDLAEQDGRPRALAMDPMSSRELAEASGLEHRGDAHDIAYFGPLSAAAGAGPGGCVYFRDASIAEHVEGVDRGCVIARRALAADVPEGVAVLLTDEDPRDAFYLALERTLGAQRFERLAAHVSSSALIGENVSIGDGVYIDDGARIESGVALGPNTYVGPDARIKPNAVLGFDGMERFFDGARWRVVRHAGGVWIAAGAHVGSCTCVDKGLFGDFTYVGPGAILDNLTHFAHSASAGRNATVVAASEVSGSVHIGEGAWVGPGTAINPGVTIGDGALVGTGSVVTSSIPPRQLAYGVPARAVGPVCECRTKLVEAEDGGWICPVCTRR
jgi:UDP-3-O-[3-hydroxymyristoyl] glucosamine N-acyltransferase